MRFESMYILQSDNCLDLLTCTSLTYNVHCSCSQLCSWWLSSPMSVTHNGEWDTSELVSRITDLSDLSESRPTCKASLTHNPTPFIIQNHNCVHVEDTNWLCPVQCYGIKMISLVIWFGWRLRMDLFVWLISGHASLKSGVCEVNPYSNVLSSDTDGASFESMQHEERITLWEWGLIEERITLWEWGLI